MLNNEVFFFFFGGRDNRLPFSINNLIFYIFCCMYVFCFLVQLDFCFQIWSWKGWIPSKVLKHPSFCVMTTVSVAIFLVE